MSKKNRQASQVIVSQKAQTPKILWGVLALAFLIKILYLKSSQTSPFYEPLLLDPKYYHEWALRLVRGEWDRSVFYGLPLYPYFLAVCYRISEVSIFFVKFVQVVLGMGTLYFVYKIGEKLRSATSGLLAVLIAAIYGPLFFHEVVYIPEALGIPLYAYSFFRALKFLDKRSAKNALLLGLGAGLATLTKAGILLFIFIFIFVLGTQALLKKEKIGTLLLCGLIYLGVLLPVPLHNWIRGGDKVFLTSHAGFNFYIGNNPKSEGVYVAPEGSGSNVESQIQDSRLIAEAEMGRPLKDSEVSKYWSGKAWKFIGEDPLRFLKLCGRKIILFFDAREISDVEDYQFASSLNPFLIFPWLGFAVLAPLVFMGVLSLVGSSRYGVVTLGWIGAYLLGLATFFVNARYRLPLLPVFFVMAALGILGFFENLKKSQWLKVFMYGLLCVLGIGVSQANLVGPDLSKSFVNAGDALLEKKDVEGAQSFYQRALEIRPDSPKAHLAMGLVLSRQGAYDQAKEHYEKSLQADPRNAQAMNNLGLWHDRQGDLETAEKLFLDAIELKPGFAQAHNNLGMVYGKLGENEKAEKEFNLALKLNPKSPRTLTNLGLIYHRMGRVEEAVELWRQALGVDPNFREAQKAMELMGR